MKPISTLLLATAVLALAACGDGGNADVDPGGEAAAPSATVEVVDFAYAPGSLEVAPGDAVTWTNQDDFAHTVTAGQPGDPTGAFDGPLGETGSHASSGTTFTTTFDEPGTYAYFCALHPSMTGEIVVTGS